MNNTTSAKEGNILQEKSCCLRLTTVQLIFIKNRDSLLQKLSCLSLPLKLAHSPHYLFLHIIFLFLSVSGFSCTNSNLFPTCLQEYTFVFQSEQTSLQLQVFKLLNTFICPFFTSKVLDYVVNSLYFIYLFIYCN